MSKSNPSAADRHIGARIKLRRMAIGMTQKKLAELLGISFQQIQKYEKGMNAIGAGRLLELSAALDMPVTFFFDGFAHAKARSDMGAALYKMMDLEDGFALAQAFVRISALDVRKSLITIAETIAYAEEREEAAAVQASE